MSLLYKKLIKNPIVFLRINGVTTTEFSIMVSKLREPFEMALSSEKGIGRRNNLPTLKDKLLCVLVYYRSYCKPSIYGLFV